MKNASKTGKIILNPHDYKHATDQTVLIEKRVDFTTKDSTIDRQRRIVRLYTEINSCKRNGNKLIREYIKRFARPAFSYLNLTYADQGSRESQNFAIGLHLNATLSA